MPSRSRIPTPHIVPTALAVLGLATGCGASMEAVYEGDVRFEHCMALDARTDVEPNIVRQCWSEWLSFYTYGQTKDRVAHARMRLEQLGGVTEPTKSRQRVDEQPMLDRAKELRPARKRRSGLCEETCVVVRDGCLGGCPTDRCRERCVTEHEGCLQSCS